MRLQFEMFMFLHMHGQSTCTDILEYIYRDCVDGGPLSWRRLLDVRVVQTNARLLPLGLAVKTPRANYRELVELA